MSVRTINPATGKPLPEEVPKTTPEGTAKAFEAARASQRKWAGMSFAVRCRALLKIKQYLAEHANEAAEIVSLTNGKTLVDAMQTEVIPCIMAADWYARNAERVLAPKALAPGSILFANKRNDLHHIPIGIVAVISPWNYPLSIPFGEVMMGLAAGNAVMLKVATQSVLVGEFIKKALHESGALPEGLFHHLVLSGGESSRLLLENGVGKIFFTGSVDVGKQLLKTAADTLTPLSLELGGNDPALVLADADLERATSGIVWGGCQNAGQSCGAVERVYVHRSVYPRFVELAAAKVKALRHGDPSAYPEVEIGAITTAGQLKVVREHLEDALAKGAKIEGESQRVGAEQGNFHPAVLLTGITRDMKLMKEETFGPLLPVVPFDTLEEAVEMANDSDLALTSSVWTESREMYNKVALQLETGVTTLNDHLYTHGCSETPWGGWKLSGLGRTHGELGLKEMCNAKTVNAELLPSSLIPRDLWWFDNSTSPDGLRAIVRFVAPASLADFCGAVSGLAAFAPKMFTPWRVPGAPPAPATLLTRLGRYLGGVALIGIPVTAAYYVFASRMK